MESWHIETARPENSVSALTGLMKLSQPHDARLSPTWVSRLPQLFATAGLEVEQNDVRDAPPALELAMHECNLAVHDLLARSSKNIEWARRVKELMPSVLEETQQGAYWAFKRSVVVGRKPLGPVAA